MKKKLYTYILILVSFATVSANVQNPDSLYTAWQDQSLPDSTRVEAFKTYISGGFLYSNPDSAFILAGQLIDFSQQKDYSEGEAVGYDIQGISNYFKGNFAKALNYYQISMDIKEKIGDHQGIANSMNNIGLIYSNLGDYPKALDYYQRTLSVYEKTDDDRRMASTLNNIGLIYNNLGDYLKALDYYRRSLAILEREGDQQRMAMALNNIGQIYAKQNDDRKALDYYQRSLAISEKTGDQHDMALPLSNIGNIYLDRGAYPEALSYFQRSLTISEKVSNKSRTANALFNIGNTYKLQGKYNEALKLCKNSLELAEKLGALEEQKNACQCLYDTYKTLGNGNDALVYLEKMLLIQDSLKSEETSKRLQQMEFKKAMLQDSIASANEARLVQQAHEEEMRIEKQRRNWSVAGGILFLVMAGSFFSRWRYVKKSKAIIEKERDRSEKLLLNILPEEIAEELKDKGKADPRNFNMVSILFTDFKGFTRISEKLSASELVSELNHCFAAFDGIMQKHGLEKIKTIGDAYMAAGGLPVPGDDSVKNTVLAALEMQEFITQRKTEMNAAGKLAFEMRVGIHTGPVVAGIVGVNKFQYDIWGDSVNTASRMESSGEVGKVNVSESTYDLLKAYGLFKFSSRGKLEVKGKGKLEMYFVNLKTVSKEGLPTIKENTNQTIPN